jgi:LytS/YehU family sensor histidine kinase
MGSRLRFELQIDEDVARAHLPPMMLLTLVENAIKHGLSPLTEGGDLTIRVRRDGVDLVVVVCDTGAGFTTASGAGTGISNVRARLAALHGGAGQLKLAARVPRGVEATIRVPYVVETTGDR